MKTKYKIVIVGAGAGGLGAGCWAKFFEQDFIIIDAAKELPLNLHNGVHYLHSIPYLPFGPDIKEITLTDGILCRNGSIKHHPDLLDCLQYSEKVREEQHPSSIMEVGKRDRVFLPPTNSLNSLLKEMYDYIGKEKFEFDRAVIQIKSRSIVTAGKEGVKEYGFDFLLSTMPLDNLLDHLYKEEDIELKNKKIHITNIKINRIVPNWLINLYIPDPSNSVYRVSILNNLASVESETELSNEEVESLKKLLEMFYLDTKSIQRYNWEKGKLISISYDERKKLVNELYEKNIFSFGRFGLWNRKLLVHSTISQAASIVNYIFSKEPKIEELIEKLSK